MDERKFALVNVVAPVIFLLASAIIPSFRSVFYIADSHMSHFGILGVAGFIALLCAVQSITTLYLFLRPGQPQAYALAGFFVSLAFLVLTHRIAFTSFVETALPFGKWAGTSVPVSTRYATVGIWVIVFLASAVSFNIARRWIWAGWSERSVENTGLKARWATATEVSEKLHNPGGILLGETTNPLTESTHFDTSHPKRYGKQGKGKLITMAPEKGNGHCLFISKSSGYKTSGIVIPNILTFKGPITVLDPKCDLAARTAKARAAHGYRTFVIDENNGLDPFRLLSRELSADESLFVNLVDAIAPRFENSNSNASFFETNAKNLLTGIMMYHFFAGSDSVLADTFNALGMPFQELCDAIEKMKIQTTSEPCRRLLSTIDVSERDPEASKTVRDIISTANTKIEWMAFEKKAGFVTDRSGRKGYDWLEFRDTDFYLNFPTRKFAGETGEAIARLILCALMLKATENESSTSPSRRRLYLLDEARVLRNMEILRTIRDEGRGYGQHLMLLYQTMGQVEQCWGRDMNTWLGGLDAVVYSADKSPEVAGKLSQLLGAETVTTIASSSSTNSRGLEILSQSYGSSESEQLRDRPLLSINQVRELPDHSSIIFYSGMPPIIASKAIYFTRDEMKALVPQDIPAEDLPQTVSDARYPVYIHPTKLTPEQRGFTMACDFLPVLLEKGPGPKDERMLVFVRRDGSDAGSVESWMNEGWTPVGKRGWEHVPGNSSTAHASKMP